MARRPDPERDQVRQLGAKTGVKPRRLGEFLLEAPNRLRRGERWEPRPNTVYLPTYASSIVWIHLEDLTSSHHAYYQPVIDPEKAVADYIGAFLRSPLGAAARQQVATGAAPPSIRVGVVEDIAIYAPSLGEQQQFLSARRSIDDLRLQLDRLDRRLIAHPRSAQAVSREITRLNQVDVFTPWVTDLPFPLASIVRHYEATASPRKQADAVLRFFEATSELACALMLAAYRNSEDWDTHAAS